MALRGGATLGLGSPGRGLGAIAKACRVLDANSRALWTRELTVEAKDFEPNGKGCGTYYEAGVALDVTARELRPRPVPPEFSMASYEAD
jgi:hypothetical protein